MCCDHLNVVLLSVVKLNTIMLSVVSLYGVLLSVVRLYGAMLSVVAPPLPLPTFSIMMKLTKIASKIGPKKV